MERHESACILSCKTSGCHVPTRWPCPSTNHSCSLSLIGWTWANLPKSLLILLVTTKLLLAQSAASLQCAHPFLLSPSPLPTLMNPLCGEIVIQVDYTVNWVMEDWALWKWISAAAVCLPFAWFIYYNRLFHAKNHGTLENIFQVWCFVDDVMESIYWYHVHLSLTRRKKDLMRTLSGLLGLSVSSWIWEALITPCEQWEFEKFLEDLSMTRSSLTWIIRPSKNFWMCKFSWWVARMGRKWRLKPFRPAWMEVSGMDVGFSSSYWSSGFSGPSSRDRCGS